MSHTPTPWMVCRHAPNDHWYVDITIGAADPNDARRIADVAMVGDYQANAAFIVQAVNSHAALVRVVKIMRSQLEHFVVLNSRSNKLIEWDRQAREALELAGENNV